MMISSFLVACNKDEDIIIDNPEDPSPESPIKLEYSVVEYTPAPGQFINEKGTPFANISSMEEACVAAEERLKRKQYVSLGAWGGYIVVKFNESIQNTGGYDFSISSNAFDGSNEPGIVWVMQDTNGNGIADDTWYELKGSYFGKENYERNYWVKYFRPAAKENTHWEDSNGETGYLQWLGNYHDQDFYYPLWIKEETYTLYGSRLPDQAVQNTVTGIWSNLPFDWGYADNFGEDFILDGGLNCFKIANAITEENEPANLATIDFIKVQTAINNFAGPLGENSTEVCGFFRL